MSKHPLATTLTAIGVAAMLLGAGMSATGLLQESGMNFTILMSGLIVAVSSLSFLAIATIISLLSELVNLVKENQND